MRIRKSAAPSATAGFALAALHHRRRPVVLGLHFLHSAALSLTSVYHNLSLLSLLASMSSTMVRNTDLTPAFQFLSLLLMSLCSNRSTLDLGKECKLLLSGPVGVSRDSAPSSCGKDKFENNRGWSKPERGGRRFLSPVAAPSMLRCSEVLS